MGLWVRSGQQGAVGEGHFSEGDATGRAEGNRAGRGAASENGAETMGSGRGGWGTEEEGGQTGDIGCASTHASSPYKCEGKTSPTGHAGKALLSS